MDFSTLMTIIIGAVFINNFVLNRFLGLCPFMGVSRDVETALGMGMAVAFVMTLAGGITWAVNILLEQLGLGYLQTVVFILIIAALVQFVEMFLRKNSPGLYSALGIYLPLITTNCAVLGVALLNVREGYTFLEVLVFSFSAAVGFSLALVIMAGIRERLDLAAVPESLRGAPIAFVVASLLAVAFMGFSGMKF